MLMWTQEIIVSDPECQIIVSIVDVVEPICMVVRSFISTVQSFNHADENCKTFDWKLTEEEMKILDSKIEECAL